MVDTFRYGLLGISDVNVTFGFLIVGLFFTILFFWTWHLLNKGTGIKV